MTDNHLYDLMIQTVQESKSLWRIKNEYIKNASDCENCVKVWENLAKQKEKNIEVLRQLVKEHI